MRSPVSRRALGECNAITSQRFGPSELTFVSALETEFGAGKPFWPASARDYEQAEREVMAQFDAHECKSAKTGTVLSCVEMILEALEGGHPEVAVMPMFEWIFRGPIAWSSPQ
jgi:hypothetical protein